MENEEMENCEPATLKSEKNSVDYSKEIYCNFCSKPFKYNKNLHRHINRMHKDKILKDQQTNTGETSLNKLKTVYDKRFLEIVNTQTRHAEYIHTNAKNITELLNDLDLHRIQIKKIAERFVPVTTHESNRKLFSCRICNKPFSTKRSLYTHKSRYHKKRL